MNSDEIKDFLKHALKAFKIKVLIPSIIVVGLLIFFVSVAYLSLKKDVFNSTGASSNFNGSIEMDMTNGRSCF